MVKWPSLSLEFAKADKKVIIIGCSIYALLAIIALISYFYESLPDMPHEIFESLIQVIAMLFGFTLIVIFYYQGKIHEHKKETLEAFLDFVEGQNEMFDWMTKSTKTLKDVVNLMPPAILRGWFSEVLLKSEKDTEALRNELQSKFREVVSAFEDVAGSVRTDTLLLILLFIFSLYLCFEGLFYTATLDNERTSGDGAKDPFNILSNSPLVIALTLISITSALMFFISAWNKLQTLSDDLDKQYLILRTIARIYGRRTEDTRK